MRKRYMPIGNYSIRYFDIFCKHLYAVCEHCVMKFSHKSPQPLGQRKKKERRSALLRGIA